MPVFASVAPRLCATSAGGASTRAPGTSASAVSAFASTASVFASAASAVYSAATAAFMAATVAVSSAGETWAAVQSVTWPSAASTCSAIHSRPSWVLGICGSSTRPSTGCATPSRRSRFHTTIRGVDGSRGIR